ncbi:ComEA family DNA-binding protein [Urbifossiella limnaea]|uniref:ComE operon protein 1 n=1 Tax=Urbifossiella limnaea TaxID=2528023 RepID=A0A517XQC3_9BACT|nr:helix-hairpin-helix domain-containing protein [Urbifossiella limnaea]QDU19686.1 ComE operon protein 1 [Urbifossiella limnaea]
MDTPNVPQNPAAPAAGSPRRAQLALAAVVVVFLTLLAVRGYGPRFETRPTEPVPSAAPIDLNRADTAELELLPGVGPRLAAAIDAHRRDRGGFRSVDDLRSVPGVGPVMIDRLRPLVRVEPPAAAVPVRADPELPPRVRAQAPEPAEPVRAPAVRKLQPGDPPIDVNAASAEELQRLPGVGPVTAGAIVAGRPYRSVAELDRVRGIGPKTLDKLRPFVVVGP